jgi:hypothetical protein
VAERKHWNEFVNDAGGGIGVVTCKESDVDEVAPTAPEGTVARIVRGSRCDTKAHTLREWAAAFQFPGHFGGNWDAFEDCINDLGWLHADCAVAIVTHADEMLPRSAKEFTLLLSILTAAQDGGALQVVLHCEPGRTAALRKRMAGPGKAAARRIA